MNDITVRKLLTLLSACGSNDQLMTQIVLEKMSQSEEYKFLSSLDQFEFLTDRGRDLEKRMREFNSHQPASLAATYSLLNDLKSLSSEFKNVHKESRIAVEEPIDRPYREVHILEKGYLKIRLEHDKKALDKSEVYRLWQGRNNFVYENDAARQLKVDMDSFKCATETQAEIRQSYVTLESFQSRFQQNRSGIASLLEYEKRKNDFIEEKRRRRNAWIRKNYIGWLIGFDFIVVIGLIIFAGVEKGFQGVFVAIFNDFFGLFGILILASVLSSILSLFFRKIMFDKLMISVGSILVILFQIFVILESLRELR